MHSIKVLMAKNFIDNLSEEVRKGMLEKAEEGIWPSRAPLGYHNTVSAEGKKVIEPDPETADLVRQLFAWYATGRYSLAEMTTMARSAGLRYRRSGAGIPTSIHRILRNPIY
jgi:site-specific DNA recombinase